MIEEVCSIASKSKVSPNILLPPDEHNGRNDSTALARVCALRVPF